MAEMTRSTYRRLAVAWSVAAAVLLLLPGRALDEIPVSGPLETTLELAAHFILFGVLSVLAVRGFAESSFSFGTASRVLGAVAGYCVLLELLQMPVPGRSFELIDIAVGWLAIWLGLIGAGRLSEQTGDIYSRPER